jgi:pilus assembly protein CpaE
MKTLIASDDARTGRTLAELLARIGTNAQAGPAVPLDLAADRASRLAPELLVLVFSSEPAAGLAALSEVRRTLPGMDVLVVGPAENPQLILQALHLGADEYLDQTALDRDLDRAVIRLKARRGNGVAKHREPGRVISVLAPSGGSGASTLAANVSVALARKYGQCGLVDLSLASGDLAALLDLKPRHTLADLCDRMDRVDQSMFEQLLAPHSSGVHLLAAPRSFADVEKVTAKVVRQTLALARVRFPFVLADLDNAFRPEQVEALWQSDTILLVLRLDYPSVRNTRRAMENLVELGIGLERVRLVANCYRQSKQLRPRQAEEALGMKIFHYVVHDPARANKAINKGVPLVLYYPRATVSKSILELGAAVNGQSTQDWKSENVDGEFGTAH